MLQSKHPPKNRAIKPMNPLLIRVVDQCGFQEYSPNSITHKVLSIGLSLIPLSGLESHISGKPAVWYWVDDLEIKLTPSEVQRLVCRALSPTEFFALRDRFGDAFDWHDDFYDQETGEALQPKMPYLAPPWPETIRLLRAAQDLLRDWDCPSLSDTTPIVEKFDNLRAAVAAATREGKQ